MRRHLRDEEEEGGKPSCSPPRWRRADPPPCCRSPGCNQATMARMAVACIGAAELPDTIQSFVAEQAEGVPFLVEEVLAGLIGEGALTERGGADWHAADLVTAAVPATFADAVRRRLRCGGRGFPARPGRGRGARPPFRLGAAGPGHRHGGRRGRGGAAARRGPAARRGGPGELPGSGTR